MLLVIAEKKEGGYIYVYIGVVNFFCARALFVRALCACAIATLNRRSIP